MSSAIIREREQDDGEVERSFKRPKVEDTPQPNQPSSQTSSHILPPSHALLGIPLPAAAEGTPLNFLEDNVGISEYIGRGEAKIDGIIKQRFTDFLVYEVDLDGNAIHLKSLGNPEPKKNVPVDNMSVNESQEQEAKNIADDSASQKDITFVKTGVPPAVKEPWPEHFDGDLSPFLPEDAISQLKIMYLQGPEPPRVSDSGWAGRAATTTDQPSGSGMKTPEEDSASTGIEGSSGNRRGSGRRGRGGGRGGRAENRKVDDRRIVSPPIESKEIRTAFHKVIRELFGGKLDTETDTSGPPSDDGSRIIIKWGRRGGGRGGRTNNPASSRPSRDNFPPFIHFTLQKTNRDTQDALGHVSRLLHVNVKDLSVAGTKDKRGVTVQRVSLKRHNKSVEEVWKLANGISGRKPTEDIMTQRGDRGIRIADLNYRRASLELGMLKGNAFLITLRNVKAVSMELLHEAMRTMKDKGFINYYGMQRFGTASVPTHSIGLALLQSNWQKAADLILQKRHGEHPDVEAARDAWLVERDLDKALRLFPRRIVAERCILESFKKQKGDTRNVMGALSTIPKNLRLMYIHAYQSYVWNAIVSERIRMHGSDRPVVGDIVFDKQQEEGSSNKMDVDTDEDPALSDGEGNASEPDEDSLADDARSRKPYAPPRVRTLVEKDLNKYTIFDVLMPLPGTSVAYPGGELGERYREFLRMDGLDPDNFVRKQREYTLNGSYRAILHLPRELSWSVLRYTDPDVSLAQSDEDKLLGFDPPAVVDDGKFMALQISLRLGTAAYATMALREVTKMDTSSHVQTSLTQAAEDQKYRGGGIGVLGEENMEASGET